MVLQSNHRLAPYAPHIPALLAKWAEQVPDRLWLAQRRGPAREWLKVTYGEAKKQVDAVTQALLDRGFGPDRPVMILSSNSIEFALLTMAAMQARAPVAPVSPAYSVMSQDHAKLKYVFDLVKPGLVFVQNGEIYARALAALNLEGVLLVHVEKPVPGLPSLAWSELAATKATDAVAQSIAAIGPKTVGKFLFTSGSTGMPKAVINTQEMMCANVAMMSMARVRKADDAAPVMLDWLPWNHTMGGNATFQGNLNEGGTTWIDDGKPLPACSRRRCGTCARSRRPRSPTCPRATRCSRPRWKRTRAWPSASSGTSTCCPMAARRCPAISTTGWKRWRSSTPATASPSSPAGARPRPRRRRPACTGPPIASASWGSRIPVCSSRWCPPARRAATNCASRA